MHNGSEGAEHGEWKDGKGRTGPLTLRPSPLLTLLSLPSLTFTLPLTLLDNLFELIDVLIYLFLRYIEVVERTGEVLVVGCHIDESVT